jgi:N-acetylmuramoyl-L-alanine amidase
VGKDIYVLENTTNVSVLIECGFLTNPQEAEKLAQEEYQNQIAQAICEGIIKWLDNSEK